ncbi:hypothetical protein Natpe_2122 [Natrinema pellirubrum DSM 15624]|uniref:Halocin C8 n=1 Tax=Natrinema pellirubrum (strain DSM 15624 / CIP 106293 / JCM 10476 / NCIMB 786 / 157) TaxID=797303 RepID=L0JNK8_NATP1|nr:halocin C8-like domain-containing protein [Natrinema pellirubrum]AGB31951.1 hypothetical protein Natpe_2122 [Natrinema pellirubrum DSM 15624]
MSEDNRNRSPLTRRKVLKSTTMSSVAIGTFSGIGSGSVGSRTGEIEEIGRHNKTSLVSRVRQSNEYLTYEEYFDNQDWIDILDEPSVYKITDGESTEDRTGTIISFPLDSSDSTVDADLTFTLENGSVTYSKALMSESIADETYEITEIRLQNGEIKKTVTEATLENGRITTSSSDRDGVVTPQGRNGVSCGQCTTIMRELCRVGCSANTGLICAGVSFVGTPLAGIGCGVVATIVCAHVAVPNDCTVSDSLQHENLCEEGGFC